MVITPQKYIHAIHHAEVENVIGYPLIALMNQDKKGLDFQLFR